MNQIDLDVPHIPEPRLAHQKFLLPHADESSRLSIIEQMLDTIREQEMAPYYIHLTTELPRFFKFDEVFYKEIAQANRVKINELEAVIQKAESEEETEIDITAETIKLAEYYTQIVDRGNAREMYTKALAFTSATGLKIDIYLTLARLDFFFSDFRSAERNLADASTWVDKGGDWERRNRLKTYQGIYHLATRNFSEAATLLLDSLATFTSTELCSYDEIAQYAVVAGILTLGRVDLKSRIVDSPELLSISSSSENLKPLVRLTNALYKCSYPAFLEHLLATHDAVLSKNLYLNPHAGYFMREMRCKAYAQLLESYKSLSVASMARSFGVRESFLESDLCRFIPSGKLNCTIDKVNGIIETNRPDNKNSQFHQLIKQGDGLLTKLQKYGAAVKLSGAERV